MRSGIWRFIVASYNAASKNCNMGAQLQSLRSIIASKLFWKIYFLYDFWCAQTCSFRAILGLPVRSLTIAVSVCNIMRKNFLLVHNYILGPTLLQWNFLQISQLSIRSGAHKLFRRFLDFSQFLTAIFAIIVAPPSSENENYCSASERTIHSEKSTENHIKIDYKPSHNTCLNYVHTRRQTKHDIQKTPIFAPTAGAHSSISPKLCMLIENVVTILKGDNHFSIQHIVFPAGAKMLIFGH